MGQHSPEPWTWSRVESGRPGRRLADKPLHLLDCDDGCVLSAEQDYEQSPTEEDARRIVACVNALAGVPTTLLERLSDDSVLRLKRVSEICQYQAGGIVMDRLV